MSNIEDTSFAITIDTLNRKTGGNKTKGNGLQINSGKYNGRIYLYFSHQFIYIY